MSERQYITGTELGEKLLTSLKQVNAGKTGRVTVINPPEAARARHKTGLSQADFARLLGVSIRTLQDWEQGRREPSGAAMTLLRVAEAHPEALLEIVT